MPPSVQPPAIVGCVTAILSRQIIIISANFTGRLGSTVLTVLLRYSEGLFRQRAVLGGPVSRNFGENLILSLRKPARKQSRGSKCFCVKGLSQVRQGWQSLRLGPPENCPKTPYSPRELGLYGPRATHGFPGF